jgi:hypothetical protein
LLTFTIDVDADDVDDVGADDDVDNVDADDDVDDVDALAISISIIRRSSAVAIESLCLRVGARIIP